MTPPIEHKREMFVLGEYLAVGNPGGDILGDWKLGDSSVAKTGSGGDDGGYPILWKILWSGESFAWAVIAACTAFILAETAGRTDRGEDGGYPILWKILWSGESFAWAVIAAWTAFILAETAVKTGRGEEVSWALSGVEEGVLSRVSGGRVFFFFFFFGGDLVGSSLSLVVSWSRLG
jgi:hypothetical protein